MCLVYINGMVSMEHNLAFFIMKIIFRHVQVLKSSTPPNFLDNPNYHKTATFNFTRNSHHNYKFNCYSSCHNG